MVLSLYTIGCDDRDIIRNMPVIFLAASEPNYKLSIGGHSFKIVVSVKANSGRLLLKRSIFCGGV